MTVKKMSELASRYEVPSGCVCKMPAISEYFSTPDPLEIGVCNESF